MRYVDLANKPNMSAHLLSQIGVEEFIAYQGGFDLWRTCDGENWLPVTRNGFNNPYNYGCRNIVSTPYGLFIGTANPFGPKVAVKVEGRVEYHENPSGGLEVLKGVSSKE